MRKLILSLALLLCCYPAARAQAPYGETLLLETDMRVYETTPLEDGGFVLAGWYLEPPTAVLRQVDAEGREVWAVETPAEERSNYSDVVPLPDGSLVMFQETAMLMRNAPDYFPSRRDIVRIKDGIVLSKTPFEPGDIQLWPSLLPAPEGYFAFYGERREKRGGTFHVPALEYRDSEGTLRWKKVFDENELHFSGVLPVPGGFLGYGVQEEQQSGQRKNEALLMKLDEGGNILWQFTLAGEDGMHFHGALQREDGNFLLMGTHTYRETKDDPLPQRTFFACVSPDGEVLWQKECAPGDTLDSAQMLFAAEQGILTLARGRRYGEQPVLALLDEDANLLHYWDAPYDQKTLSPLSLQLAATKKAFLLIENRFWDGDGPERNELCITGVLPEVAAPR